jgi:hypothetical protein
LAQCATCLPGTFATAGSAQCSLCAPGSYQSLSGQSSCTTTPQGTYSLTGAASFTLCPAGTFGNASGLSACIICPAGRSHSRTGVTTVSLCTPCAAGSFSDANGICQLCPPNTFSSAAGSPTCTPCAVGTTNYASGSLKCFGPSTGQLLPPSPTAGNASSAAISPSTGATFVVYPSAGAVYAYNADGSLMNTFTTGLGTPRSVAVASDGTVYVTDSAGGRLLALNPTTGAVTVVVASGLAASATNGVGTPDVVPGPVTGSVLVIDAGGSSSGGRIQLVASSSGPVTTLADSSNADSAAIGSSPTSAAANPATGLLYVGTSAGVVVVNSTGFASSWFAHGFAGVSVVDVAFVPASGSQSGSAQLWATLSDGNVQVVDAATGTLVRTITPPAGVGAVGASVNPITGEALVFSSANSSIIRGVLCGSASSYFMQPCAVCGPGSAPDASGTCVACAPGSFSASAGSAACTLCPLGSATAVSNSTSCVACTAGFYAPTTGLATCAASPPGSYTISASSVAACPAGSFLAAPGSSSASDCVLCPPGYVSAGAGARLCSACPFMSASASFNSSVCAPCGGPGYARASIVCATPSTTALQFAAWSAVDPASKYLITYSSTSSPSANRALTRVDWGTWANAGTAYFPAGATSNKEISGLVTDGVNAFALAVTNPPILVVASVNPMAIVRSLTFPANIPTASAMIVDISSGFLFVFSRTSAVYARVNLTDAGATFNASFDVFPVPGGGSVPVSAGRVSPAGGVAYLVTKEDPARLLTVRLSDMVVLQTVTGLPSGVALNVSNVIVNNPPTVAILQADTTPNAFLVKVDLAGSGSYVSYASLPTALAPRMAGNNIFTADGSAFFVGTGAFAPPTTDVAESYLYKINASTLAVLDTLRPSIGTGNQRVASFAVDTLLGGAIAVSNEPTGSGTGAIKGISLLPKPPALSATAAGAPSAGIYLIDPFDPNTFFMPVAVNATASTTYNFVTFVAGPTGTLTEVASAPFPAAVRTVYDCDFYPTNATRTIACSVRLASRTGDIVFIDMTAAAVAANGGVAPFAYAGFSDLGNLNAATGANLAIASSPINASQMIVVNGPNYIIINPSAKVFHWTATLGAAHALVPEKKIFAFTYQRSFYIVGYNNVERGYVLIRQNAVSSISGSTAYPLFDTTNTFETVLDVARGYLYVGFTHGGKLKVQSLRLGDGISISGSYDASAVLTSGSSNLFGISASLQTIMPGSNNQIIFASGSSGTSEVPVYDLLYVSVADPASPSFVGYTTLQGAALPPVSISTPVVSAYAPITILGSPANPTSIFIITGAPSTAVVPFVASAPLTSCGIGYVWDPIRLLCTICPEGTFSTGAGTTCMACLAGTYSLVAGAGSW